jgi:hypothetical protein
VVLEGTRAGEYRDRSMAPGERIDARAAAFIGSSSNRYPINLGGGSGACIAGGRVTGSYDRNASWDAMHDVNNAAIRMENDVFLVDGLRVDNVTDGIRPVGGPFTIRQVWLSYIRDDCVENDHVQSGVIEDSLFDGCYVAVAERPSSNIISDGYDGRGGLLTIRRSLLRLEPMPHPRGGDASERGHGQFFKWHDLSTDLALHDNVFLAEQVGQSGGDAMGMPDTLTGCSNNVMVWLGPGSYPAPLPSCFTVTKDRAVWDRAVADWKQRHPHVGAP